MWLTAALLIGGYSVIMYIAYIISPTVAAIYTAFGSNALMSILFVRMLYKRKSHRGQSVGIALSKGIGTALQAVACYWFLPIGQTSLMLQAFFVVTAIVDIYYTWLLFYQTEQRSLETGLFQGK